MKNCPSRNGGKGKLAAEYFRESEGLCGGKTGKGEGSSGAIYGTDGCDAGDILSDPCGGAAVPVLGM